MISANLEVIWVMSVKTNRLLIAEETTRGTSVGARIVEIAQKRLFDWLDHEIVHVTGTDSSPVVSKVLEAAALAGQEEVEAGLLEVMGRAAEQRQVTTA